MTDTPRPITKGAALLSNAIRPVRPITMKELAKRLGVSRETLRRWANGEGSPPALAMAKLEDLLQIPMRAWVEDDSSPTIPDDSEE